MFIFTSCRRPRRRWLTQKQRQEERLHQAGGGRVRRKQSALIVQLIFVIFCCRGVFPLLLSVQPEPMVSEHWVAVASCEGYDYVPEGAAAGFS